MAGWGGHLAGEGFFVAVPTQPAFADHALNGRVLAALVEKYRTQRRVALMGFSMGGLTTLLTTSHTVQAFHRNHDPRKVHRETITFYLITQ
jgi:dienelactone hydrolase